MYHLGRKFDCFGCPFRQGNRDGEIEKYIMSVNMKYMTIMFCKKCAEIYKGELIKINNEKEIDVFEIIEA